jgi:hypothetical protein
MKQKPVKLPSDLHRDGAAEYASAEEGQEAEEEGTPDEGVEGR